MKKILTAIALSIAIPAVAHAQAASVKADCCDKMKAAGTDCCKDMAKTDQGMKDMKTGSMPAGHDMHAGPATAPATAPVLSH